MLCSSWDLLIAQLINSLLNVCCMNKLKNEPIIWSTLIFLWASFLMQPRLSYIAGYLSNRSLLFLIFCWIDFFLFPNCLLPSQISGFPCVTSPKVLYSQRFPLTPGIYMWPLREHYLFLDSHKLQKNATMMNLFLLYNLACKFLAVTIAKWTTVFSVRFSFLSVFLYSEHSTFTALKWSSLMNLP